MSTNDTDPFDNIGTILQQSQNKLATVTAASVGINCLLWSGVSLVTIIGFNILRPRNKVVYEPKVKYHVRNKKPPKISDGFFSWVSPLIHTKEPELLDKVGLDAVTFLRFLRLLRWLFLGIALLLTVMVIPVNVTYSVAHTKPSKRDALSILTLRDVTGNLLFVHVAATYLITFMIMGIVWKYWSDMVRLRHEWFVSDEYQKSFYARTLIVLHVPKKLQSDEGLVSLFQSLQMPYPTTAVHIGRRVGKLPELVEYHNEAVRELERYLVQYLKDGKIAAKRPMIHQGGCLCCGGQQKDAIDFYTAKLKRTEGAIEQWRDNIDLRQAEPYGFASLASVPYAHIVAQKLEDKHPKGTTIMLAPNPKDLIWANLNMTSAERHSKHITGFFWLSLVAFVNTLPLTVISAVANLNALAAISAPFANWATASPETFTLVASIIPPIISSVFGYFLPVIMRKLSRYQGAYTRTRLDRAVVARYFAFLVISQLFIFSLIGVLIQSWGTISAELDSHASLEVVLKNLSKLPQQIYTTYLSQSNYWLSYFPLRGFLVVFDLAQVINLVWIFLRTRMFGRTPRDIREWTKPPDFEYAIYYSNLLFLAAVGLVYAPLAPLVGVAAAIVFWLSSVVYKYQLMFVFTTKIESGGRLWNVAVNRLLTCATLMQLLMTLTIGLRLGFLTYAWIATIPPILMIPIFKYVCTRKFDKAFRYFNPTEADIRQSQVHSASADNSGHRLEKRFGHPALYADLFTPLVHAKMVHLLPQVYSGHIRRESAELDEYDGRKVEAQVLPGGIKIAGIEQRDLEYDPALYGRDRGEADWDAQSSHRLLNDEFGISASKLSNGVGRMQSYIRHGAHPSMQHPHASGTPAPYGQPPIELARLHTQSDLNVPLLPHAEGVGMISPQAGPYLSPGGYPGYAGSEHSLDSRYTTSTNVAPVGMTYPPSTSAPAPQYYDSPPRVGTPQQQPTHDRQQSSSYWTAQPDPPPQQHGRQGSAGYWSPQQEHARQGSAGYWTAQPEQQAGRYGTPGPQGAGFNPPQRQQTDYFAQPQQQRAPPQQRPQPSAYDSYGSSSPQQQSPYRDDYRGGYGGGR